MLTVKSKIGFATSYKIDTITGIKFEKYGELELAGGYDLQDYDEHEVFLCVCFKDGNVSHFPTSTWSIEF